MRVYRLSLVLVVLLLTGLAPPVGAEPGGGRLAWQPCHGAPADHPARCARVTVPVDWSEPGTSARTELGVARIPAADPEQRIGVLMFNAGGPGVSAPAIVRRPAALRQYFPQRLLDRFDVVGVDVRATGFATPLDCAGPARDDSVSRFPIGAAGVARLVDRNLRFGLSCLSGSGPLARHLDTATVARDLDHVRAALGAERISFLGMSYGTMLAQSYAELFPHRLRALVLDGVVDRAATWPEMVETGARAVEDGFAQFAEWCAETGCAPGDDDAYRMVETVLERADAGELTAAGEPVTAEQVTRGLTGLLNVELAFPRIATGLTAGVNTGDVRALVDTGGVGSGEAYAAYRAILCQDVRVPATDAVRLPELARRVRALAPTLRGASEFWDIGSACPGWPVRSRWRPHPWRVPDDFARTLILSNAHDVATPRVWAERVHRQLPDSVLLRFDGYGHTPWMWEPAARTAAVDYLLSPE